MFARRNILGGLAAGLLACASALPALADRTLLSVSGDIGVEAPATFSDAELSALTQNAFSTGTIWTEGVKTFGGPTLQALLDAVEAGPGDLELVAANNYKVLLPREAIEETVPIIANRIDGEAFGIRDKGPLWVVFPFDADPRYQNEEIYAFSIWQLTEVRVLPE